MAVKFANLASTTLSSAITNSATSIAVADASLFPTLGSGDYFYATIGEGSGSEIVKVTAISSNTLTVTRAQDGTTASAFSSGETIALRVVAAALDDIASQAQSAADTESVSIDGDTMTGALTIGTTSTTSIIGDRSDAGSVIDIKTNGSLVGTIGSNASRLYIHNNYGNGAGLRFDNGSVRPSTSAGASEDATTDLGASAARFKDGFFSGTISSGAITSSGEVDVNLSAEGKYFEGGSGSTRRLSITSGTNISAHAKHTFDIASTNGKYVLQTNSEDRLTLDSTGATFSGTITSSGNIVNDVGNTGDDSFIELKNTGYTGNITSLRQNADSTRAELNSTERPIYIQAGSDGDSTGAEIRLYANQQLGYKLDANKASTFYGTISSGAITASEQSVFTGNAISGTPNSNAQIVAADSTVAGIAIHANDGGQSYIWFGDNTDNAVGRIYYNHSADKVHWRVGGTNDVHTLDSSGNATFSGDLTVSGNLTVSGTTTTIDTANLNVEDNNITLNYSTGDSSASANGAGITIQDAVNSTTDASMTWNATDDRFEFSHLVNVDGGIRAVGADTSASAYSGIFRNSGGSNVLLARNDGRVFIPSGYLYVQSSEGIYSTGAMVARGGITNDGGNNLSISSGGTDITFNSKNFTSVGTISSGAITSSGTGTFDELTLTGGSDNLTFTEVSGDWSILNAQQSNGLVIYDGTSGVTVLYNNAEVGQFNNSGFDVVSGALHVGGTPRISAGGTATFTGVDIINSGMPTLTLYDNGNGGGGAAEAKIEFTNTAGTAIAIGYTDDEQDDSDLIISTNAAGTYGGYLGLTAGAIADAQSDIILEPKTDVRIATGGLKIGTTTVIDSSRNLTSLGTINTGNGIIGRGITDNFTLNGKSQPHYGFNLDPTGSVPIGISGYYGISLATQGAERLKILQNGNIQVGGTTVIDSSRNLTNIGTIASSGQHSITGGSTGSILLKIGSSTQTQYVDFQMASNSGVGELFKNGTAFTAYGGASSFNVYNSNGLIAFHPSNTANVLQIDTTGLNVGASRTIRMNGTTVIDSSRNLTNIGSGTFSGTIATQGNVDIRRNNNGDGQIIKDINWLNSFAQGSDDRIALIRANNQGGGADTRGGSLTFFTRQPNSANFNSFSLDNTGTVNVTNLNASSNIKINGTTVIDSSRNATFVSLTSTNKTATPDKIGDIKIARIHGSTSAIGSTNDLDTFILSKTDGGWGGGTQPSGADNAEGIISLQTHSGNYYSQLNLVTNGNNLFIRSAYNATSYGSWEKLLKENTNVSVGSITTTGDISLNKADGFVYLNNVGTGNSGIYVRGITSSNTLRSHTTDNFRWEVLGSQKMELNSSGVLNVVGGYQVNGTTRINSVGDGLFTSLYIGSTNIVDTSRNLTNIGGIGLSGNITFGNNTTSGRYDIVVGSQTTARGMLFAPYTTFGTRFSGWDAWIGQNTRTAVGTTSSGIELASSYTAGGASALNIGFFGLNFYTWSSSQLSGLSQGSALSLGTPKFSITGAGDLQLGGTTVIDSSRNVFAQDISVGANGTITRSNHHSGHLEGSYNNVGNNAAKSNPIYTIGSNYNPTDAAISGMYGIGFTKKGNATFLSGFRQSGWGLYVASDGNARVWLNAQTGVVASTAGYDVGNVNVIDSSRNIQNVPVIYGNGGSTAIELNHATYLMLSNPEGARCLYLGDSGDRGNYYDNDTHYFRTAASAVIATINSSLTDLQNNLKIRGTQGFNATGETASIYLGDNNSEIRATYNGGTSFFLNGTDRMEIEGGTGNLNLKTGNFEINGTTVISSSRVLQNVSVADGVDVARDKTNIGAVDANNLDKQGFYGNSSESSNQPFDNNAGTIVHMRGRDNNYKSQLFSYSDSGELWIRGLHGSGASWSSWSKVFHDGYHPNADKWTTARTLSLTGDATGSVSWDGSANASITVAVGDADTVDSLHASSFIRSDDNDNVTGHTEWQDGYNIRMGNGADLRIWHDGSNHYFCNYLHAGGNFYFQGEDSNGSNRALIYMITNSSAPYVQLFHVGNEKLRTVSEGINVYGDLTATGNVTAYSDIRKKTNIKPLEGGLDIVKALEPKRFDWIESGEGSLGFIAQEVEEYLPELVETKVEDIVEIDEEQNPIVVGEEEVKSLDYGKMVSVLWAAVKEQSAQIETLNKRIEELENGNN